MARTTHAPPVLRPAHQAIDGALRKLKRAVASEIDKHDAQGHRGLPDMFAVPAKPD